MLFLFFITIIFAYFFSNFQINIIDLIIHHFNLSENQSILYNFNLISEIRFPVIQKDLLQMNTHFRFNLVLLNDHTLIDIIQDFRNRYFN